MTVHQYDIVMDVTVVNRTKEVQNLCLELATMGDLKLVERPQNYTLGASGDKARAREHQGELHGDRRDFRQHRVRDGELRLRNVVVLNDIHIDIMDYISPASCSDLTFRAMWAEFEWENKVALLVFDLAAMSK